MHIIREEMEEEAEEEGSNTGDASDQQPSAGGLSRAFKPPLGATRAVSLHNLLDQCLLDDSMAGLPAGRVTMFDAAESRPMLGLDKDVHPDRRSKTVGIWDRKQEVTCKDCFNVRSRYRAKVKCKDSTMDPCRSLMVSTI